MYPEKTQKKRKKKKHTQKIIISLHSADFKALKLWKGRWENHRPDP